MKLSCNAAPSDSKTRLKVHNIASKYGGQVCWEKFARYFEVDLKEVKLSEGCYVMDPVIAVEMVDENTICAAAILGSTLNG